MINIEVENFNKNYQKIVKILHIAKKAPYYADIFRKIGINLECDITYEDFSRIPIIDKSIYRKNWFDFIVPTHIKDA